jgi:hypothetical protein
LRADTCDKAPAANLWRERQVRNRIIRRGTADPLCQTTIGSRLSYHLAPLNLASDAGLVDRSRPPRTARLQWRLHAAACQRTSILLCAGTNGRPSRRANHLPFPAFIREHGPSPVSRVREASTRNRSFRVRLAFVEPRRCKIGQACPRSMPGYSEIFPPRQPGPPGTSGMSSTFGPAARMPRLPRTAKVFFKWDERWCFNAVCFVFSNGGPT